MEQQSAGALAVIEAGGFTSAAVLGANAGAIIVLDRGPTCGHPHVAVNDVLTAHEERRQKSREKPGYGRDASQAC